MQNQIQVFSSPQFGEIRTIEVDGTPYFVGNDVAAALGYEKPRNAIARYVDSEDALKRGGVSKTTNQYGVTTEQNVEMTYINESGVYALVFGSKLPTAKAFKRWVTSEVLPSIRKSGGYSLETPLSPAELILRQSQLLVENERKMQELESKQKVLESELAEVKQRTTTNLDQSTIVAYVSRNAIKLDVTRYGAMGKKASSLCKKRGIEVTKINDVRWGVVSVYPDTILDEVFKK